MSEAVSLYPEDWPREEIYFTDEPDEPEELGDNDPFAQMSIDDVWSLDCE